MTKRQHSHELKPTWYMLMYRCYTPSSRLYKWYGAKGIRVCDRWHSFDAFLADTGERPDGYRLYRKDVTLDYTPENCEWRPNGRFAANRGESTKVWRNQPITLNGETRPRHEWAAVHGIPITNLRGRLSLGWSDERALTTPFCPRGPNKETGK